MNDDQFSSISYDDGVSTIRVSSGTDRPRVVENRKSISGYTSEGGIVKHTTIPGRLQDTFALAVGLFQKNADNVLHQPLTDSQPITNSSKPISPAYQTTPVINTTIPRSVPVTETKLPVKQKEDKPKDEEKQQEVSTEQHDPLYAVVNKESKLSVKNKRHEPEPEIVPQPPPKVAIISKHTKTEETAPPEQSNSNKQEEEDKRSSFVDIDPFYAVPADSLPVRADFDRQESGLYSEVYQEIPTLKVNKPEEDQNTPETMTSNKVDDVHLYENETKNKENHNHLEPPVSVLRRQSNGDVGDAKARNKRVSWNESVEVTNGETPAKEELQPETHEYNPLTEASTAFAKANGIAFRPDEMNGTIKEVNEDDEDEEPLSIADALGAGSRRRQQREQARADRELAQTLEMEENKFVMEDDKRWGLKICVFLLLFSLVCSTIAVAVMAVLYSHNLQDKWEEEVTTLESRLQLKEPSDDQPIQNSRYVLENNYVTFLLEGVVDMTQTQPSIPVLIVWHKGEPVEVNEWNDGTVLRTTVLGDPADEKNANFNDLLKPEFDYTVKILHDEKYAVISFVSTNGTVDWSNR